MSRMSDHFIKVNKWVDFEDRHGTRYGEAADRIAADAKKQAVRPERPKRPERTVCMKQYHKEPDASWETTAYELNALMGMEAIDCLPDQEIPLPVRDQEDRLEEAQERLVVIQEEIAKLEASLAESREEGIPEHVLADDVRKLKWKTRQEEGLIKWIKDLEEGDRVPMEHPDEGKPQEFFPTHWVEAKKHWEYVREFIEDHGARIPTARLKGLLRKLDLSLAHEEIRSITLRASPPGSTAQVLPRSGSETPSETPKTRRVKIGPSISVRDYALVSRAALIELSKRGSSVSIDRELTRVNSLLAGLEKKIKSSPRPEGGEGDQGESPPPTEGRGSPLRGLGGVLMSEYSSCGAQGEDGVIEMVERHLWPQRSYR